MKGIDWQMLAFVSMTLLHDYWIHNHLPRVYYWNYNSKKDIYTDHRDIL